MRTSPLADRLIPGTLIGLALVPCLAGTACLTELGRGATVTIENARFIQHPLPVVVHIIRITVYSLLGAFQFAPEFRHRRRQWHRIAGRVLVARGLTDRAIVLSGGWLINLLIAEWEIRKPCGAKAHVMAYLAF